MSDVASDVNLADVQDDLYGESADEFVRRRADAVRAAKQRGDRELAAAVAALRKPTAAAQALNSFARARDADIEALLDVGARLREAVDSGDGDAIRAGMRERNRKVAEVMRELRRYSGERGEPLSASVGSQVEQSLRAAMSSEEYATRLRRGVLDAALSDLGLDAMRASTPRAAGTKRADEDEPATEPDESPTRSQRQAAEEQASTADDAVRRVEGELDSAVTRRSELEEERRTLAARLEQVQEQLAAAREAESEIEARLRDARSRLRTARTAARRER